ncbi:hypothetical protein P1X14_03780 [Sphingomonas sp. AOB5]|uniref:hypothetical protein n=1 Tax=Sphingomonas sp. AOB5 TaxID=3034017 RepID=UPI0023F8565A|nr:hypothetical protein [Sphingomonas sp. AOB5]MDF7774355.1 hypothetical protein [Sphingomonas sp. AOB5]
MIRAIAKFCSMLAVLMLAGVSIPASAHKGLKPKELVNLDPTKGYILVRIGLNGSSKGSAPVIVLARMNVETGVPYFGNGASKKEFNVALAGGGNFLSTDGKTSLYVIPVNPGRWAVTAAGNTVFSLGTYGFDVAAGEIVNAGTLYTGREDGKSPVPEIAAAKLSQDLVEFGTLMNIVMTDALLLKPPVVVEQVPAGLAAFPMRHAEIIADIRFPNTYTLLINRAIGLPQMAHNVPEPKEVQEPAPAPTS